MDIVDLGLCGYAILLYIHDETVGISTYYARMYVCIFETVK